MRIHPAVFLGAALPLLFASQTPLRAISGAEPKEARLPNVSIAGVEWLGSPAEARDRARKERKPVLMLHLFGRLDEEFC